MSEPAAQPSDVMDQETNFTPGTSRDTESQQPLLHDDSNSNTTTSHNYGSFPSNDWANGSSGPPKPAPLKPARAVAPDLLRGLLMVLMSMDHTTLVLSPWEHSTAGGVEEQDGQIVDHWTRPLGYLIRTLTHLCGPGFVFLLGVGIVYFGASRSKFGWSAYRMARHFAVRAAVLTGVTVVMGLAFSGGEIWFLNVVLFALAVDYLIAGLLWLVIAPSERACARGLMKLSISRSREDEASEPMLSEAHLEGRRSPHDASKRAATISWHVHNLVLLALAAVSIQWNIWLSPNHGHCRTGRDVEPVTTVFPDSVIFRIWFYPIWSTRIINGFPPLAWVSFAILGILYGRVLMSHPWRSGSIALANLLAALAFSVLFVLTRLLQFGNLSEDCVHTPDQHGSGNPYLASPQSFFYIIKYPPDLAFWAFGMAGNLLFLAIFSSIPLGISKRFTVLLAFGRSALFFYITHMLVLFFQAAVVLRLFGKPKNDGSSTTDPNTPSIGVDSAWIYFGVWAITLAVMYPLCRWYSGFKSRKGPDSIWRFF